MIKKLVIYYLPVVLWMWLIYFLSSLHKLQASPVGWEDFLIRKTAHFLEYFILFVLNYRGLSKTFLMTEKKKLLMGLLITIVYSISDEFHQALVSGRDGRPRDVFIDSLGAIAGLIFISKFINILPNKIKNLLLK